MSIFHGVNNPGVDLLDLTSAEVTFVTDLAGLSFAQGDILYYDGSALNRLAAGTSGHYLKTQGAAANPVWAAVAVGGDVSKVGTPADSQIGVWTGDGTIEGAASLTYDGSNLLLTGDIGITGTRITKGWFTDLEVTNAIAGAITGNAATVTNATLTTALTVNTGTVTLTGNVANSSVLTIGAGAVSVSGSNTGDQTSMSGISDTKVNFDTALSDGNFLYSGDAPTAHAASHAVGGADTIFPADPNADRYLMWDDDPGALVWSELPAVGANTALSNLASVAINTTLVSDTDNTDALGTTAVAWSDLFLGSGGVITFNSAPSTPDITLTHSADTLTFDGGTLALGTNSLTMTGSIAATGARVTKGWFTDLECTNAIAGSITGNAATVTNATLTTALTVNTGTVTLTGNVANSSVLTIGAGAVSVSGANTGDNAANSSTMYIGTTETALNRASAAQTLAGITLTTPNIGTPSAGTLTNCTGLPLTGLVDDTTTALGVGTLELGHASDTTLSRSAAGVLAVEGVVIPSISSTNTLTNKRITARVWTAASDATPDVNSDDYDAVTITALAAAITDVNVTGTPTNFQKLIFRIKDDGTARAIAWGTDFEAKGVALPTTTVLSKVLTVGFIYDTVTSRWGCVASAQEA